MGIETSLIDQLFAWVMNPNWPTVALLVLVIVLGVLLYRAVKSKLEENDHCWDLYANSQKEILDLTGFFVKAVTLARAPRGKEQQVQLAALELAAMQFQEKKRLAFEAEQAKRRNRNK